ncbi:hypothetical protein RF11_16338 [Thelohanellus kitauei]|uniref:Integrase catalytic domain-containing protein n=1 Tax=Thelohanellus kitauei TaxID=669202 RepID=A0A0C2I5X8_THEKT|nr:hypothetical protein RF11_16338 [Thelohanellus kitauei]
MDHFGICKRNTTPYSNQSDGMVKRFNGTSNNSISKMIKPADDGDKVLQMATLTYNVEKHESTGSDEILVSELSKIQKFLRTNNPISENKYIYLLSSRDGIHGNYMLRNPWEGPCLLTKSWKETKNWSTPIDTRRPVYGEGRTFDNAWLLEGRFEKISIFCGIVERHFPSSSAVLSQIDNQRNEEVICFASGYLNKPENNYEITPLKLFAIVWALKEPFVRILKLKDVKGQIAIWLQFMNHFTFKIEYQAGGNHRNSDSLSIRTTYNTVLPPVYED